MSRVLVSGVKPTGRPHIGNYFGAMKQFVDLQDKYESRIFVANLHAMTTVPTGLMLENLSRDMVLDYLAIGLDPKKTTIYLQSDIPHVTELAWIFDCITTMSYLTQKGHAFKDAITNYGLERELGIRDIFIPEENINVGLYTYPVLMAADILIHDADIVPVGRDQNHHIEITRDTAEKFNRVYGQTFKIPESFIYETNATVPGTDGRKMSKSYKNTIPLFATDEEIEKAVMSIVTDSSGDYPENVFKIHQLVRPNDYLDKLYSDNKGRYKVLKEALIEDLKNFIGPMRERRSEWESKPDEVEKIIAEGGVKMRKVAHEKMVEVRKKVGLTHHE